MFTGSGAERRKPLNADPLDGRVALENPVRPWVRALAGLFGLLFAWLAVWLLTQPETPWLVTIVCVLSAIAFLAPAFFSSAPDASATREAVSAKADRLNQWASHLGGVSLVGLLVLGVSGVADLPESVNDLRSAAMWSLAGLLAISWAGRFVAAYYHSQANS